MIQSDFSGWYAGRFPGSKGLRTVGREAELPLVFPGGTMGDARLLWSHLAEAGWQTLWDRLAPEICTGFAAPSGSAVTVDAGYGNAEVVIRPCVDLWELRREYEGMARVLVGAAAAEGMRVLGHGTQPINRGTRELWMPRPRYLELIREIGEPVHLATVVASDQCHVAVEAGELASITKTLNGLAPVAIALMANARVYDGRPNGFAARRELMWDHFPNCSDRVGLAPPLETIAEWARHVVGLRLTCFWNESSRAYEPGQGTLAEHLKKCESDAEAEAATLLHEAGLWWDARPRAAYGTVEFRPCCQQPPDEHWVVSALTLGLAENHQKAAAIVGRTEWRTLRGLRLVAIRQGLGAIGAIERVLGRDSVEYVLQLAAEGLARRGRGEEEFLEPLFRRLRLGLGPADRAVQSFEAGGITRLVKDFSYTVE